MDGGAASRRHDRYGSRGGAHDIDGRRRLDHHGADSTPDGETWHFTTNEAILRIQQGGALTDVPFTYSGVITVADNGDLVPAFD